MRGGEGGIERGKKRERRGIDTACQTTLSLFAVGLGCVCDLVFVLGDCMASVLL